MCVCVCVCTVTFSLLPDGDKGAIAGLAFSDFNMKFHLLSTDGALIFDASLKEYV